MNNILKYGLTLAFAGLVGYLIYQELQKDAGFITPKKDVGDEKK